MTPRSELIFEVVEDPECGYRADALGYPIYTFGKNLDELKSMVQDAVDCYFEGEDEPRPEKISFKDYRKTCVSIL